MSDLQNFLASIVPTVWTTIFEFEPMPVDAGALGNEARIMARIAITGDEPCIVAITCGEGLARQVAAGMLAAPADTLSAADVQDALGEFGNMVAGNLKAMLPPGHQLSLPEVVQDVDVAEWASSHTLRDRCAFQSGDDVFVASVYEAATEAVA